MQSFQLLGGKYQQGEQILPGVIQTFRSYEVPTGRPVFIHRIPLDHPAAQEIAGLLSAALVHSPAVRKMLLNVYENEPYRSIVTEASRQCVPLREWLEREAGDQEEQAARPKPPAVSKLEEEPAAEPSGPSPDAESPEFARLFHEALSGKLEKSRRGTLQKAPEPVEPAEREKPDRPVQLVARPPQMPVPRERAEVKPHPPELDPQPSQPDTFPQPTEKEAAGRSKLIIVLVVLGIVAVAAAMVVVLLKK